MVLCHEVFLIIQGGYVVPRGGDVSLKLFIMHVKQKLDYEGVVTVK